MKNFFKEYSDSKSKYSEDDIIKMHEFLVDNIFVVFAGTVFQQIVGITVGTNCAPLLADIFLYSYETEFIQTLLSTGINQLASRFNFTYRYIDDVLSINNPEFENYLGQIYPVELEEAKEEIWLSPSTIAPKPTEKSKEEAQRAIYRAPVYNVPPFRQIGQGGNFLYTCIYRPEKTTSVAEVEIMLPVNCCWIPLSSYKEEVENVSRQGLPSSFLLAQNTKLVEDAEIMLPAKFGWIPFSSLRGEDEIMSANRRPGRPSCFSDRPQKHKVGRGRWEHTPWQVSFNSLQQCQRSR